MPELKPELPDLQEEDDQIVWATTPAMRMRKQRYVNQSVAVSVESDGGWKNPMFICGNID